MILLYIVNNWIFSSGVAFILFNSLLSETNNCVGIITSWFSNFSFGLEIGKFGFKNVKKVLKNNTVEGYWAAKVVYQIITSHGIKAPILTHIYKILYNNESETNFVQNIINEINK